MHFFRKNEYIIVIVGAIIAVGLAIGLSFVSQPNAQLMPKLTLSQLAISAAALFIVSVALYLTIVQVRKSMAKPKLWLAFSEKGEKETTIDISKIGTNLNRIELTLWIFNEGDAIAKTFQIDLKIPKIYYPSLSKADFTITQADTTPRYIDDKIVKSIYKEKFPCFIRRAANIDTLQLTIKHDEYQQYKDFAIEYDIFGDWAETQEGKLKVKINKQ